VTYFEKEKSVFDFLRKGIFYVIRGSNPILQENSKIKQIKKFSLFFSHTQILKWLLL
jgi:hypothetical protein